MLTTPNPEPAELVFYGAPIILSLCILFCCFRLCLIDCFQLASKIKSIFHRRDDDEEIPNTIHPIDDVSTLSRAFANSPFFELFRQQQPPPTYDETSKYIRDEQNQSSVSVIDIPDNASFVVEPPIDDNPPPPYFLEVIPSSTTIVATNTVDNNED